MSFLHSDITQVVEIRKYDKDLPILHSQYHGCWCSCDERSQGINNHDIDLVNTLRPRQDDDHFADNILNVFSWMKIYEFD